MRLVASDSFADVLREQLASVGHVTLRRMFGKTGVFCDRLMLAMVRDDALYFRVDDDNRALFKEAEAFPPLNYEKAAGASTSPRAVADYDEAIASTSDFIGLDNFFKSGNLSGIIRTILPHGCAST
jgi:TfoX/Sxy family transcriptional regulator of competence genes